MLAIPGAITMDSCKHISRPQLPMAGGCQLRGHDPQASWQRRRIGD